MSDPIPPPQATDILDLFNFTDNVNPVILQLLIEAGILRPAAERGQGDLKTPRVECQLQIGAVMQRTKIPAGATDRRDALPTVYACTFVFTVATDRTKNDQAHGRYEAIVRVMAAKFFHGLNSRLAWYAFLELEERGTASSLENAQALEEDISQIRYEGQLAIRPSAWPAGT